MKTELEIGVLEAEHGFRLHAVALMTEIVDCGLDRRMGVLRTPIQIFMRYLDSIATRASELNDPILNKIMCDMALYEIADPTSKNYDKKIIAEVYASARDLRSKSNKIN